LHADLRQREALGHAQQHLALALGELHVGHQWLLLAEVILGLGGEVVDHAPRDRGRQRRFARADAAQLLGELLPRLLLEQVAEGAGLQCREQVIVVVVDRHHHRLRFGLTVAQRLDHLDTGAVGEAQVDQRQVEALGADVRTCVVDTGRLGDLRIGEHLQRQHLQPGADLRQVFEKQDARYRTHRPIVADRVRRSGALA